MNTLHTQFTVVRIGFPPTTISLSLSIGPRPSAHPHGSLSPDISAYQRASPTVLFWFRFCQIYLVTRGQGFPRLAFVGFLLYATTRFFLALESDQLSLPPARSGFLRIEVIPRLYIQRPIFPDSSLQPTHSHHARPRDRASIRQADYSSSDYSRSQPTINVQSGVRDKIPWGM